MPVQNTQEETQAKKKKKKRRNKKKKKKDPAQEQLSQAVPSTGDARESVSSSNVIQSNTSEKENLSEAQQEIEDSEYDNFLELFAMHLQQNNEACFMKNKLKPNLPYDWIL